MEPCERTDFSTTTEWLKTVASSERCGGGYGNADRRVLTSHAALRSRSSLLRQIWVRIQIPNTEDHGNLSSWGDNELKRLCLCFLNVHGFNVVHGV